ncbi:acetyl-CoA synthetase-like protein [Coleophoma cylindrospora]|uniref:Acetyl-CoA synthetase-like protein n=1 Tax=Coleophoma cylindrospora TaxID=1849047 RepID=A0A3D8RBY4_9HELO|nr:acetyl-CoA synthetase-like protein [Coleophoma cylindrospora]
MAPMMLESSTSSPDIEHVEEVFTCSDPTIIPSAKAPQKVKDLWSLHGGPHSKRYSDPELVSLAALVRYDGRVYEGQKAFLYPLSADPNTAYGSMTWDEFDRVTERIAAGYGQQLQSELERANATAKQPTIALIGRGTTLEYFCTQLALQKLGVRVLLLAESNALDALHHLLHICDACAVITDRRNVAASTKDLRKLEMVEVLPKDLSIEQAKKDLAEVERLRFQDLGDVWERHSFIIHSSGSTGMPKPIIHTNRSMMQIARMYRLYQEFSVENWFLLFPLYHIGGISIAFAGLPNGQILSFPPLAWPPSSSSIFTAWKTMAAMGHPVDIVHCPPTLIENMYDYIQDNGGDFSPLIDLTVLQPGGAKLADRLVEDLARRGVNVKTTYGSTEIGPPMRPIPHTRANPKCYSFRILYPDNPFLKLEEVGENLYECIVYKGYEFAAELWEGKPDDEPYRTNDLFYQDPPGSGFYVLQGRKDDILVHSNGENTSAGPLQIDIQTSSKVIKNVVAFGHSRPCVSLLVEVNEEYDPTSASTQESVWETVTQVNSKYPGHSQIMRSMIHILPKGNTLPVTPKGNVKRKEAERQYTTIVEKLYADIENPMSSPATSNSSQEPLPDFIRGLFASLANVPSDQVDDWTTLYDLGIDSRLALSLRTSLSARLGVPVSLSVIFENPSIASLVSYFEKRSLIKSPSKTDSSQVINRIISKLESELRSWPARSEKAYQKAEKQTVVLTGASGSLGTALLQSLSASENVEKIYAMVRGPNSLEKLVASFKARKMDTSIVDGPTSKIEVLNSSMQDPLLGLDIETYHTLATTATVVIQNAWKMDFNQGVEYFEDDCIRNTMHLLRLCHAGRRKTIAFTSSISTCMGSGHTLPTVSESPIGSDPSVALSTGYAQSKYIMERLLQTSTRTLQIPTILLRVGQMCGSTVTGHWNTSEMWPIMFSTSAHPSISALPLLPHQSVDWIPVNIAAASITDLLSHYSQDITAEAAYHVHNITNPHSIPWTSLLTILASTLVPSKTLETVSMREWVDRLNLASSATPEESRDIQGLRLLQFFENMVGDEEESKVFETAKTQQISKSLQGCGTFCEDWVKGNLEVWREMNFLA